MAGQRSTAVLLAGIYVLLVIYASLYPFEGWRWPPGIGAGELLVLPWPPWRAVFDEWSNLLGYAPLGAIVCAAAVRSGSGIRTGLAWGVTAPALLSFALEVGQQFIPVRVPSRRDWVLNVAGAAIGALLAAAIVSSGHLDRWQRVRERWFVRDSSGGVVLLLLWPAALLFPAPVALGVGQVFDELRALLAVLFDGTPWAADVAALLSPGAQSVAALPPLQEGLAIGLGMLAPALLALVIVRSFWQRLLAVVGTAWLAVAVTTLSTLLNFGPAHALAWITPVTMPALGCATVLAGAFCLLEPRLAAALGLVALTALVALVSQAGADPYYAASLQLWEQGRFVRFHGLARWIGWLWPYAAMAWLMARLSRRG
jgi:VanZ family protein